MTTWGELRAGDKVRWMDRGIWTVAERWAEDGWADGERARFLLRQPDLGWTGAYVPRIDEPVELLERAETSEVSR